MSATRFKPALQLGILALGFGLLGCTDAAEIDQDPPNAPVQVLEGELAQLPKPAASNAGPSSAIPCDPGEPPGKKVDPPVEAAPVEDPYAG